MRGVANIAPEHKSATSASEKATGNSSDIYSISTTIILTNIYQICSEVVVADSVGDWAEKRRVLSWSYGVDRFCLWYHWWSFWYAMMCVAQTCWWFVKMLLVLASFLFLTFCVTMSYNHNVQILLVFITLLDLRFYDMSKNQKVIFWITLYCTGFIFKLLFLFRSTTISAESTALEPI